MKKKISGIKCEIDGDDVNVDVPAEHVGDKLRFFVIFSSLNGVKISPDQKAVIDKQLTGAMVWHNCSVEKIEWHDVYLLTTLLIPWNVAPQTPIDAFLEFASTKDKVLRYHFFLSNVAKLTHPPYTGHIV